MKKVKKILEGDTHTSNSKKGLTLVVLSLILILLSLVLLFNNNVGNFINTSIFKRQNLNEEETKLLSYSVKNLGSNPLILINCNSLNGLEYIIKPDGTRINCMGKQSIAIDFPLEYDTNYEFNIKEKYEDEKIEIIRLDNILAIALNSPLNSNKNYTFPNLEIYNSKNVTIKSVLIQFTSEISNGDSISLTAANGVSVINTRSYAIANISNLNAEEIESYLRTNLHIVLNSAKVGIKATLFDTEINQALNYCVDTGHYYEYIASPGISWSNAKSIAESKIYNGLHGYLATITSAKENAFMHSLVSGFGWLGGSCDYNYIFDSNGNKIYSNISQSLNNWYWVTGPEAGQRFSYTNWNQGEPNNAGNEYYLHCLPTGLWNDFANNNGQITGYIVEYGGQSQEEFDITGLASDKLELQ